MLKALHGAADIIPDGVITASELYIYLEKELAEVTSRQTPGLYTLKHHEKGEYIFQIPGFVANNLEKAPPLDENSNPYRGLESFNEEHKDLFFGRERVINELYFYLYEFKCTAKELIFCTKLTSEIFITWLSIIILRSHIKQPSLMIVNGASGTGKSSLVKAGLLPCLRDDGWYIVSPFRPGKSPFLALTQAILLTVVIREASVIKAKFSKNFNQSKYCCNLFIEVIVFIINILAGILEEYNDQKIINSLSEVLQKNLKSLTKLAQISNIENSAKLLLVIDQFEELVTVCSEEEKEKFLTWLEKSVIENSETVRVIITLRSDFKAQFSKLFDVKRFIDVAQFTVPIMTQDEFREIIEKPATEKVLYFEPPELVDELINEVVQMPGALPLLSFTLSQLYLRCCDRWQEGETNRAITLEDYKQLDGVMGSLKKTATDVFEKLIKEKKAAEQTIRHVMLRMVSVSGDELARRRVLESELEYPEPKNSQTKEVIKAFTDARLLVKGTSDNGEAYVEPAHDALVNGWNQILVWKNQQQENLLLQRGLTPAVMEWRNIEQRHNKVEPLLNFFDKGLDLIGDLWSFSKTLLRLIRRNSQEKKQKSLKKSRFLWDSNPRLNLLEEVLYSSNNWLSKTEAEFVQISIKRSRRRIARGWSITTGVILILSAITITALIGQRQAKINEMRIAVQASEVAFNSGSKQLTALVHALQAGTILQRNLLVRLWKPNQQLQTEITKRLWLAFHETPLQLFLWHESYLNSAEFSPDGKYILTASKDKTAKLWNLDGEILHTLEHDTSVGSAKLSPDGKYIITIGEYIANSRDNKPAKLWNLDGKLLHILKHEDEVSSVEFSPNSKYIITTSRNNKAKLWNLQGETLATFDEVDGGTYVLYGAKSVRFSPDSKYIITSSSGSTAKLWNLQGKLISTMDHKSRLRWVNDVSFSADGKKIITFSLNAKTAKVWNLQGKLLSTLKHQNRLYSIQLSPDSTKIVTTSEGDKKVRLWNINGELLDILEGQNELRGAFFSPDGKKIVTKPESGKIVDLWNSSGEPMATIKGHEKGVISVSFSRDSKKIVTTSKDGTAKVWNLNGELINNLEGHGSWVNGAQFNPDGTKIVTFSSEKARVWNLKKKTLMVVDKHLRAINGVQFSPDGTKIVTISGEAPSLTNSSGDGTAKIWNLKGELLSTLEHFSVNNVFFSSDGYKIITVSSNEVKIWNLQGKILTSLRDPWTSLMSASLSPDGRKIIITSQDGKIATLSDINGKFLATLRGHKDAVWSASFSPDGTRIVTASSDQTAKLWDINGKLLTTLWGHKDDVWSASFSPDGTRIVTASSDKTTKLWDINGKLLKTLQGHESGVMSASFSPDGTRIITASSHIGVANKPFLAGDHTARLWNLQGQMLAVLRHENAVYKASFSPDAKRIITASGDKTAKLWNLQGQELTTFKHQHKVGSASFSPDGKKIVTASNDRSARLWNLKGKLLMTFDGSKGTLYSPFLELSSASLPPLSDLTGQACKSIKYFLKKHPLVKDSSLAKDSPLAEESDRNLCDGIPEPTRSY